jgi:hypothetical protein
VYVRPDHEGKQSSDAAIAAVFITNPVSLFPRIDVVRFRSLCDPPNGGSRTASRGMRGNGQCAIEVRTQAGVRAGQYDHGAAMCWSRSIHFQFFMAGFAEGTQRIGESAADRLSDPGERRVLHGISIDDYS